MNIRISSLLLSKAHILRNPDDRSLQLVAGMLALVILRTFLFFIPIHDISLPIDLRARRMFVSPNQIGLN